MYGESGRRQLSGCKDLIQKWKMSELNCNRQTQELDNKLSIDQALLRKQSGQVEKIQSTLDEMHATQRSRALGRECGDN